MSGSGQRLGRDRYTLVDRLGSGAAGTVWRGLDALTGSECAVKVLRPQSTSGDGALARLSATVAWVGRLAHPGVVAVDDLVVEDGTVALVSRLVPGESLRSLIDRLGALPPEAALAVVAELCDILAAARGVGVSHGDIKPSNVLLEPDPHMGLAVRLTDFGLAGGEPTEAADVFAAAIVLCEALTGRPPFAAGPTNPAASEQADAADADADTDTEIDTDCAAPPLPSLLFLPPELPESVFTVLAAGLDEDPRRRPSAGALAAVLREAAMQVAGAKRAGGAVDDSREGAVKAGVGGAVGVGGIAGTSRAGRTGALAIRTAQASAPQPSRTTRPWIIAASALGGVAAAVMVTFGLASRGAGGNSAAVVVPVAAPTDTYWPTPSGPSPSPSATAPTNTPSPSPTRRHSASPSATPSAVRATGTATATSSAWPVWPYPGQPGYNSRTGRLYNYSSGGCLDTSGGYYANGVVEQIWTCNSGANQVWTLTPNGQLAIDYGQYCLDDAGYGGRSGTKVQLWACGSQPYQRWSVRPDGSIAGSASGLCLVVAPPGYGDGTQIELTGCDGQRQQAWSWD